MQCRAVTYLIALTTMLSQSAGELIMAPRDTESKVGDTTYFNCSTNLETEKIFWYHGNKDIYTGDGILEPYQGRFEIDRNASDGSHNLVIHSVESGDAGEYICIDDYGSGTRRSAELIVLDNDPDCQSNIQPDGVIGQNIFNIPSDEVQLTCNVTYHGNIPPQMEWRKVGDISSTKDSVTSNFTSSNRLMHILKLKGDISLDNASYVCQTTWATQNQYKCTSQIIKVLYFVEGNTMEQNVVRGEKITCIASNSTFSCISQWYHDNYTCPLSCDEAITAHLLGEYMCTVKCHVRGRDYYFEALKAFVVEPTTSPLLSTSGTIAIVVAVPIVIIVFIIAVVLIAVLTVRNRRIKKEDRDFDRYLLPKQGRSKTSKSEGIDGSQTVKNNHQFLAENINSSHLIDLLHEKNCITPEERDHLNKQPSSLKENDELLQWMTTIPFKEDKGQKVLECFRQAKQNFVADLLDKGGVVIKSKISTKLVKVSLFTEASMKNAEELKEKEAMVIERLNRMQGLSLSSSKNVISENADDEIVIAPYCHQEANGIVIWFWCKSEYGRRNLKKIYDSDFLLRRLITMFKNFSKESASSASKLLVPTSINIFVGDFENKVAEEEIELLHKIKEEANLKEKEIRGIAILNEELFIVRKSSSKLKIYNCNDFRNFRLVEVKELVTAHNMCSCKRNNCLYIMDEKTDSTHNEVLKISTDGNSVEKWLTEYDVKGYLSATTEGNVIITSRYKQMLLEYSPTGKLEREINLPNCSGPRHAIKRDDCYIVCHEGFFLDRFHRICLVDKEGNVEKSFGHQSGSAENQLNMPSYLAVGSNGCVIVADCYNNRVLLLDANLQFKTKIVPKNKQRFLYPYGVALSETLLVVQITSGVPYETTSEEAGDSRKVTEEGDISTQNNNLLIERDCRILVFDIQPLLEKYNGQ